MDIDVSEWILEFLLRQNNIDDQILNNLIRFLPLPSTNSRLKKSLLLRKIDSGLKKGTISERTIEFLEQIVELDLLEGNTKVSEAMKTAYCTVAMHCTAKFIEEITGDTKLKYSTAVRRIWSDRVRKMEMNDLLKTTGLIEENLLVWIHDIEAGVSDLEACENVMKMFNQIDVLEVVRRYVNEAKEKLGPSFLELAFETILSDGGLCKAMGLDECVELNNQSNDSQPANNKDREASSTHVSPKNKQISPNCTRKPGHRTHKRAVIVDPLEKSHKNHNYIRTPEVNRIQEALETSCFELHQVVKDPLPDALKLAESLKASTSGANMDHNPGLVNSTTRVNDKAPSSSQDRNDKSLEADGNDGLCGEQNKRRKFSILERNNTAHTVEWSDSIDTSEEGSPRPHLPSPKPIAASPLSIYKIEKLVRKRKPRKWSLLEEDTLRTAVQKYGKGHWKLILSLHRDIFEDRTEVDLKDKWRNLTRW